MIAATANRILFASAAAVCAACAIARPAPDDVAEQQKAPPLADFFQQPCVFHCNDRLGGEVLQQSNLLVLESTDFSAIDRDGAEQPLVFAKRYNGVAAGPFAIAQHPGTARAGAIGGVIEKVLDANDVLALDQALHHA